MTEVEHSHAARLVTRLSKQRSSGKFCDVCVSVEEQKFLAHKCVLSANSDQLDALIVDATNDDNAGHHIEIEINGASPVGFEIVLEYFYTGVLRLEPATVKNTLITAGYLGLSDIVNRCTSYCQSHQPVGAVAQPGTIKQKENAVRGGSATRKAAPTTGMGKNPGSVDDGIDTNGSASKMQPSSGSMEIATSVPQIAINVVQQSETYSPASANINMWTTSCVKSQQQRSQLPLRKRQAAGRLIGGGDTILTKVGKRAVMARADSPAFYTTLSVASHDSNQSGSRTDRDLADAERAAPVPATPARLGEGPAPPAIQLVKPSPAATRSQTTSLDETQFTETTTNGTPEKLVSTSSSLPVVIVNKSQTTKSEGNDVECEMMQMQNEVELLRIQHQQLQRLHRSESGENGDSVPLFRDNGTAKRKRKAASRASKSEDGTVVGRKLRFRGNVKKSKSVSESIPVTVTSEHLECLYQKYPEISKEPPIQGLCDVMQLLQHGRARQRKSSEQNALNTIIRTILDMTGVADSSDSRVQDAVCLIMDRFTVLQEHMNDAYVRKQLTIKVKHSIHCKKWRLKRHKMRQLEMSPASPTEAQPSNNSLLADEATQTEGSFGR